MSTGQTWLNLYPGKILGLQDLEDHLAATMRAQVDQIRRDVYGAGGALDARASITVAVDELTLTADLEGYTPLGKRLVLDAGAPEHNDVPFESAGAIVYHVGARHIDVPAAAQDGIDGLPHFSHFVERVGLILSPAAVALDVGGGLLLTMTGSLPLGSRWSVSAATRPVVVWFEDANGDPASKSSLLAIEAGSLVRTGAVFTITTTNRFGQAAASLDPARYKVALLGPTIYTDAELPGAYATDFLDLGTVLDGVFDNSGAPLVNNLGSTVSAFNAQHHNVTGVHLDVTADTIVAGAPVGMPAPSGTGDAFAQRFAANALVALPTADSAIAAPVVVQQAAGDPKVELRSGDPSAAGGGGSLHFPSPAESADTSVQISTDYPTDVDLRITNLGAGRFNLDVAGGDITVPDGNITIAPAATALGYAYSSRVQFAVDYHPIMGGWGVLQNSPTFVTTANPPYVHPTVAATILVMRIPLTVPNWYRSSPAATSDLMRVVSFAIRHRRVNAADTVQVRLYRLQRDGGAAQELVQLLTAGVTGAADGTAATGAINHIMDRGTYAYFLEVHLLANSTLTDARLMNVEVVFDKFGIE